ncbi:MAG: hypothetical protein ACJ76F_03520 [Bacteroidia bacterium]
MRTTILKALLVILPLLFLSFTSVVKEKILIKLTVEKIFPESDEEKIMNVIKEDLPQIEVTKIDYDARTITVKADKEINFDLIKQSFDKVGLRIAKEEKLPVSEEKSE